MRNKPNIKRLAKRRQEKELFDLQLNWNMIIWNFADELFTVDWERTEDEYDPFRKWNNEWVSYCQKVSKKNKIAKPDPLAFYNYAMNHEETNTDRAEEKEPEAQEEDSSV